MPPRGRKATTAKAEPVASTMKELKDTLWKAADKLRGSMDASQYKDVILGLVFLKYVSDAFDERREQIRAELEADGMDEDQIESFLDEVDEYRGHGVFWVHRDARWSYLAQHAKGIPAVGNEPAKSIGQLIDEAMDYLMGANPSLHATLPRIFNRDNVDQRRLGELIDLFNSARFTGQGARKARDLLGEVYEYFLEKFAKAEGKRGGEFYTPASVVRVLVEVLEPAHGRVYDPCCGSGGMFVQTEKFLEAHHREGSEISVYGQELNERTWRMAKMNLAIHGLNGNLASRWGDTFARDQHPGHPGRLRAGQPAVQHQGLGPQRQGPALEVRRATGRERQLRLDAAHHLQARPRRIGRCGDGQRVDVHPVRRRGSDPGADRGGGSGVLHGRAADTAVPVHRDPRVPVVLCQGQGRWSLAGRSIGPGRCCSSMRVHSGYMVDRAERSLSDDDIALIAGTFHAWRGAASAREAGLEYADKPGFCYSAALAEIKAADYALTPGRYVGAAEVEDDGEPIEEKIERLTKLLFEQFEESARLANAVRDQLDRLS